MVTLKTLGRIAVGVVTIGSAIAIVAPEAIEGILGPPFERLGPHMERAYDWWARVWLPKEITAVEGISDEESLPPGYCSNESCYGPDHHKYVSPVAQAAIDCSRCGSFMLSDEDVCGNCAWDRRS